jgi:hypothetical protein
MKINAKLLSLLLLFWGILFFACMPGEEKKDAATETVSKQDCVEKILTMDDSLAAVRNHAPETVSLSEAILQYVNALEQLDYEGCPEDFKAAFESHREAWMDVTVVTDKYPDMRGEMHGLFKEIEVGEHAEMFNPLVEAIWDTWEEIEIAAEKTTDRQESAEATSSY